MINNYLSEISQPSGQIMRDVVRCDTCNAAHSIRFECELFFSPKNERTKHLSDTATDTSAFNLSIK